MFVYVYFQYCDTLKKIYHNHKHYHLEMYTCIYVHTYIASYIYKYAIYLWTLG